jgi:hypothetical protein
VILKAQNSGKMTVTLTNVGSKPHGFSVQCLPLNAGCTACFPPEAKVASLAPGERKTLSFVAPDHEGIYTISSDVPGDTFTAQLILQ